MTTKLFILSAIIGCASSLHASTSLAFVSGNSLIVPNTADEVSPYTGTITGDPALNSGSATSIQLYCDDFNSGVTSNGQNATWSVNINSVTSASLDGTNGGRFEVANNLPATTTLYEEAAWLASEIQSFAGSQVAAVQDNQINAQEALWELTGNDGPNQNAGTGVTGVTNIAGWLANAKANYASEPSGYYNNWFVITQTGQAGQTSGGYQEFLAYSSTPINTTNASSAPEPASFFLIGSGLMAAGFVGRRFRARSSQSSLALEQHQPSPDAAAENRAA